MGCNGDEEEIEEAGEGAVAGEGGREEVEDSGNMLRDKIKQAEKSKSF